MDESIYILHLSFCILHPQKIPVDKSTPLQNTPILEWLFRNIVFHILEYLLWNRFSKCLSYYEIIILEYEIIFQNNYFGRVSYSWNLLYNRYSKYDKLYYGIIILEKYPTLE